MSSRKASDVRSYETQNDRTQNAVFTPILYQFHATPRSPCDQTFSLQQPFATLFDNLIMVLWSVYSTKSKFRLGVNQLQWALEFMRCMKVDYGYPESIKKIVEELEEQLIKLYAKIGELKREEEEKKKVEDIEREFGGKLSESSGMRNSYLETLTSYNEDDVMEKLGKIKLSIDPITDEFKYLKELNLLGSRKQKPQDPCAVDRKSSKNYMIGALKKILHTTTDSSTKIGVEELIKELRVDKLT